MGVAIGQHAYIDGDLASGRLVAPLDFVLKRQKGYFLVCPKDHARVTKVLVFKEWMRSRLAADGAAPLLPLLAANHAIDIAGAVRH